MEPEFSVIVPTYRRPAELALCLRALARQDFPRDRFEVIVADDGGGGLEDLRDFAAHSFSQCVFVTQSRSGPGSARNLGARHARGRFLAFTDDDCEPSPQWLSSFSVTLRAQSEALVGGRTVNSIRGNRYSAASQHLIDFLYDAYTDYGRFFTSNNFAMSSRLFASLGGFDAAFHLPAGEDRDFCLRWAAIGPLIYSPTALVYHSHFLTLHKFWQQHFRYGQGAHQLHRRMRETGRSPLRVQAPGFYFRLFASPFKNSVESAGERLVIAMLLGLSQTANVCGFAHEALNRRRKPLDRSD
ncbi:MAG TPA: glycosyltransferase [Bryobacteraceae bacterium]|nr:glycosyltransferase [Bryobacteraceae bacterium]